MGYDKLLAITESTFWRLVHIIEQTATAKERCPSGVISHEAITRILNKERPMMKPYAPIEFTRVSVALFSTINVSADLL